MHLSMLSPMGVTPGICGAFDLCCVPHPWEFDLESRSQGGDICFFLRGGIGLSHIIPCAHLCAARQKNPWKTVVFNEGMHLFLYLYKNTTSHYSFSTLIDGTPYFVGIVVDVDSLLIRESSVGSLLNIFHPLTRWGIFDQIWPNFGAPRWGLWPKILLKSRMPHICPGSPPSGLTLIHAL